MYIVRVEVHGRSTMYYRLQGVYRFSDCCPCVYRVQLYVMLSSSRVDIPVRRVQLYSRTPSTMFTYD
jgi:hypothetical protein